MLTLPNGVSTEYVYDLGSRLAALIYRNALGLLGDLTYQYDATGNRTGVGGTFARTLLPDPVPSAAYDAANHQLQVSDKTMTFDDNGSLAALTETAGATAFGWDPRNRLTTMTGPTINANFAYDALGRRARRTVDSLLTQFHYDGFDVVREIGGAGDASYLRTLNIDEALTRTHAVDTVHYLAEALGSTVALTDGAGALGTTYTYEPFGRTLASGLASGNPFQFTGRENDGTELHYYRARYYHSGHGRFISADPIDLAGDDINFYAYVRNNPATYLDPYGLRFFPGLGRFLSPSQRPIVPPARPIPRTTPQPEPLPRWTPAPNPLPRPWQLRNPKQPDFPHDLPACLDPPCVTPGSGPPAIPGPIPGPREKPAPRPEPQTPPEWEECYRAGICT